MDTALLKPHPGAFFKSPTCACHFHTHISSIRAATEHKEEKQKQRENLQPASQRLRHASQQQYYLNNKRRMGYKDGSQMNNPHSQPSYPLHGPRSNHDSNMDKPKAQAQPQSTHQSSACRTTTRTMENPPPYDPLPQAYSQSTYQPSTCSRAIENPPPYDRSHPYGMQVDGKAGTAQEYSKSK